MRTIFIVNPKAGQGKNVDKLIDKIQETSKTMGAPAEVYVTQGVKDAEKFATNIGIETGETKETVRLIACGGDGTLNEVLNGSIGFPNIAVGVLPIGTGNDFCKNFYEPEKFMDIEAQLRGTVVKSDAIRYHGIIDGTEQTRYCANMFNIGFDCNVVDMAARMKTYPLISGSFAYLCSIIAVLFKKKGANLKVEIDGEVCHDGPLLLTAVANGSFCGGGIKSAPYASVQDGIMDINIIYNVSRIAFLKKLPAYSKGTHMELSDIDDILLFKQAKKVVITPKDGIMRLCTDGEISDAEQIDFEVVPEAFDMLVPGVR